MSVYKKLMQARLRLQAVRLNKSGFNEFARYKYFELGDFLPTIQSIMDEVGLCGIVSFDKEEAHLNIFDVDNPDQSILISSPMGSANLKGCHEVQNIGAVETYQRRYLWVTAFEIVEHDVLDAIAGKTDSPKHKPLPATSLSQERQALVERVAQEATDLFNNDDAIGAYESASGIVDSEEKIALWALLPSNVRAALKKHATKLKESAALG
jgi:hypothetical protein